MRAMASPACLLMHSATLQGYKEAEVAALLKKVPVKLGGGKVTTALSELVPAGCSRDLERACDDWARSR